MHFFSMATVFVVVSLVGVEFSVAAFVDPAAWRLDPGSQLKLLSHLASVLGIVMPVWYSVSAFFICIQTWLNWHTAAWGMLLTAAGIWLFASVGSIIFLVPLNTRVAEGDADWQRIHRIWDKRHRVRTAALAIAAVLFTFAVVR